MAQKVLQGLALPRIMRAAIDHQVVFTAIGISAEQVTLPFVGSPENTERSG